MDISHKKQSLVVVVSPWRGFLEEDERVWADALGAGWDRCRIDEPHLFLEKLIHWISRLRAMLGLIIVDFRGIRDKEESFRMLDAIEFLRQMTCTVPVLVVLPKRSNVKEWNLEHVNFVARGGKITEKVRARVVVAVTRPQRCFAKASSDTQDAWDLTKMSSPTAG